VFPTLANSNLGNKGSQDEVRGVTERVKLGRVFQDERARGADQPRDLRMGLLRRYIQSAARQQQARYRGLS
jgi:hypothetical protein